MIQWNSYDNQIYSIGKGPTKTTIEASPKVSDHGTNVLVEGKVLDISTGTKDSDRSARFPDGVPAVSDASQSAWMEYVYMQQTKPTNATGVPVTISVLDPNGNTYSVGTTTSDASGNYKLSFTPQVPGDYTVIANFQGSESYWPSQEETAISVGEAAPTASPIPVIAQPPIEMYIASATIAIIIAIAIIGLVIVMMLRKRP